MSLDRINEHNGESSIAYADALAQEILLSCGGKRTLDLGSESGHRVRALLRLGVDAIGVDVSPSNVAQANGFAPDHFQCASALDLPFESGDFDTVVSAGYLEYLADENLAQALKEIRRVVRRSLFLRIATAPAGNEPAISQSRAWWERRFFEAGFRKHPSYYQVNKYEALENDEGQITILLERIPDFAFAAYPLDILAGERDLHMDMLRETGSRSDAHVGRYQWALPYIRPGDIVLDAACGLGYGSHVLQLSSTAARTIGIDGSEYAIAYARLHFAASNPRLEFRCGFLPDALVDVPDHSIDVVISFETLEHVHDSTLLLAEFHRILTPGGRLLVSVPNDWSDETGEDPNPYHVHVYTLARLRNELSRHFKLEALAAQTANQCKSGPERKVWRAAGRSLQPFSPHAGPDVQEPEAEWWLAVAMRSPLDCAGTNYRETSYPSFDHPAWNVTTFAANYDNPWLVRGMVDIGHRIADKTELQALAQEVYSSSEGGSVDQGAALCVIAYQLITDRTATAEHIAGIAGRITDYVQIPIQSPHGIRWRVSLLFVLGKLWMEVGDFSRAIATFENCVAIDAMAFSPLLCNRTVEARLILGALAVSTDDKDAARRHWQAGITTAQQAVTTDWRASLGDISHPAEFGLPELASVLEYASSCAYALANLEEIDTKYWWWLHLYRDRLSQTRIIARQLAEARDNNQALTASLQTKQHELNLQGEHLVVFQTIIANKQRELDLQGEHLVAFQADIAGKQVELDLQGKYIVEFQDQISRQQNEIVSHQKSMKDLIEAHRGEIERLDVRISQAEKLFKWMPAWLRKHLKFL